LGTPSEEGEFSNPQKPQLIHLRAQLVTQQFVGVFKGAEVNGHDVATLVEKLDVKGLLINIIYG
jgi:triosephosphate isomerase